jgi:hypothetical protein
MLSVIIVIVLFPTHLLLCIDDSILMDETYSFVKKHGHQIKVAEQFEAVHKFLNT